jgi:hypothetical protein
MSFPYLQMNMEASNLLFLYKTVSKFLNFKKEFINKKINSILINFIDLIFTDENPNLI